jgi:hypothetical protein
MSTDQSPEKVKLYSGGGGGRPGVRAVSGAPMGAQRQGEVKPAAAEAAALVAPEGADSGVNWLVLILFVLGCAIGGALFTLFMPF